MATNYEVALKAEAKRVVRCFCHYTTDQVSTLYARGGRPSRDALDRGKFYYVHPDLPGISFPKRKLAAQHALEACSL